jgi:tetratricopeptide (TPR) repeat protein
VRTSGPPEIQRLAAEADLLEELLACPRGRRAALLDEERFHSSAFLDLLLEECHAALPFDPLRGDEIASAVSVLGRRFEQEGTTDPGAELERKCRAYCLKGAARRLLRDHRGAEDFFEQVAFMDVGRKARALFCQSLGLSRWDQGRYEEAAALLHHAARRFRRQDYIRERGACLALAGLLAVEQVAFSEADELLTAALPDLDVERRPWLACAAMLGLALSLCEQGFATGEAHAARERAWRLYAPIPNEEAMVSLYWLEGRVAAGLGDTAEAGHLLESVRKKFLQARRLPESTLATLQIGEVLAEAGREPEIAPLVEELAAIFEGRPGLDLALGSLRSMAADSEAGALDHTLWLCVGSSLRMLFPQQGVFFQPVPFA